MRKILASFLAFAAVLFTPQLPAHAAGTLEGYGVDTIAGYSALLSTTPTTPEQKVEFYVIKPDNSELFLTSETDLSGVAKADLYGYHTREAGTYQVSARLVDGGSFSAFNTFEVYAGSLSDTYSTIETESETAEANGTDKVYVTVTLKDEYGNPLQARLVNLISSRSEDVVERVGSATGTDINGRISFTVSSQNPGVSSLSAFEVASGEILSARSKIIFMQSLDSVGGSLSASLLGVAHAEQVTAGPIARLEIYSINKTMVVNEVNTFSVRAVDTDGNVVTNYTGTVYFTSTDSQAVLPQRYTFTAEDLGDHEFELAVRFLTVGTHQLQVTDWDDTSIQGTASVTVTEKGSTANAELVLTSPQEGTYATTSLKIAGTGPKLTDVDLYDGNSKLKTLGTTVDGAFSYTANGLASGEHVFQAKTTDGQTESNQIRVIINNQGPQVLSVHVTPQDPFVIETPYTLFVESSPSLESVKAVINHISYTLTETSTAGTYSVAAVAPSEVGSYPISLTLEDSLGNVTEDQNAYTLYTTADETRGVFGVRAKAGNKKVDLSWSPTEGVSSYRIDYGIESGKYTGSLKTQGAVVTQTVSNLINGRKYFFIITGLDEDGADWTSSSEEVSATPFVNSVKDLAAEAGEAQVKLTWTAFEGASKYRINYGITSGSYFNSALTTAAETEITINNLVNGQQYYFIATALDPQEADISDPSSEATAMPFAIYICSPEEVIELTGEDVRHDGHVILNWEGVAGSNTYAVYAGESVADLKQIATVENATTWEGDFPEGEYYFAVRSVCPDSHEAAFDFERPIKVQTGPALIIITFISILFFALAWRLHLLPEKVYVSQTRKKINDLLK